MKKYNLINTITGWAVFLIAAFVYLSCIEPTASFWDCGEYIATAFKLEVGHPPGAPLFNLIGRFFTLFAPDLEHTAGMINAMSAMCSAFTILFLFWTITAIAKKIALAEKSEISTTQMMVIMGSGLVGSLAYTFSDSFWFSAVEGEVYAMSSFFTAIVFWAILKWEQVANEKHNERWLVLIAFLMGLSIGVHLLNLLAIPALVFVYYFKKYETTTKGFIFAGIISVLTLGIVQAGIIPKVVSYAAKFELFFVNSLGMPFNSGTIFYFILVFGGIIWGLYYTTKKNKPVWNTIILSITVLLIGYSSFFVLIIRSQANTPMDENNPENAINLLSYLNREQYGDWPIGYGQYYNSPLDPENPYKDGNPVYTKKKDLKKYIITDDRKNAIPNYDPAFCTIFPRMHSDQANHIAGYKSWAEIVGTPVRAVNPRTGESEMITKPTFSENIKFFFKYQFGHMYGRYFMWNFVGKQNDIQGHGGITHGNWISGIEALDEIRLGNQSKLSASMKNNNARNRFYFLPLILGILGVFFHFKKDQKDAFVTLLLFLLTGIAIIIYLNNTPYQPRERDYGYVGSFYAFCIWVGIGVYAIQDFLKKYLNPSAAAVLATIVGFFMAPFLMAKEGWDDHNRSNRFTGRDFAYDYLNSCAPNAILFTNGDNDTFPLWYAQEVEGIRTDVRVVNLSLSNTDWYIEQMRRKAYDSDPIPLSLNEDQYRQGTRDYIPFYESPQLKIDTARYYNIKDLIQFIASEDPQMKIQTQGGKDLNFLPTRKVYIPVDSAVVLANGTVSADRAKEIPKGIMWDLKGNYIMKNELMIFDILATNNWKRPVYFAITVGDDSYMNLENYFQLEGLAYRLVPLKNSSYDGQAGKVDTEKMYDNLMNKFKWGGMEDTTKFIYMDENNLRMTYNFRNNFARLADELIREGKNEKAIKALDKSQAVMPRKNVPLNYFILPIAESYYRAGEFEKANKIVKDISAMYEDNMNYYFSLEKEYSKLVENDREQAMSVLQRLVTLTQVYKQEPLATDLKKKFDKMEEQYTRVFRL